MPPTDTPSKRNASGPQGGFVDDDDEYVTVAEGRLRISVGDATVEAGPGDLVRIPAGVVHSLKTLSSDGSVWLYGYGRWGGDNG